MSSANECRLAGNCNLAGILLRSLDAFYAALDEYTLTDLIRPRSAATIALRQVASA
jgi:hypothetical protein